MERLVLTENIWEVHLQNHSFHNIMQKIIQILRSINPNLTKSHQINREVYVDYIEQVELTSVLICIESV